MSNRIETIRSLVRPYISIVLVSVVAYLGVKGKIVAKDILYLAAVIIAFHFGERKSLKRPPED